MVADVRTRTCSIDRSTRDRRMPPCSTRSRRAATPCGSAVPTSRGTSWSPARASRSLTGATYRCPRSTAHQPCTLIDTMSATSTTGRQTLGMSRDERLRLAGFGAAIAVLHVVGWALFCTTRLATGRGRTGTDGVHVRPPARVRRRPHRRRRRHHALSDAARQEAAGRRVLLLAGPLDDRVPAVVRARAGGEVRRAALPGVARHRRRHRGVRVGHVPVGGRHPQPDRADRHREGLPRAPSRATTTSSSSRTCWCSAAS